MRLLSRDYRITALCFYRRSIRPTHAAVRKAIAGLGEIACVRAYRIPQEQSRLRFALDHARSIVERRVYTRFALDSAAFRGDLRSIVKTERVDLVHIDSLDLSAYIRDASVAPVICGHHNVESSLLQRRAAGTRSRVLRSYLAYQARRMEEEERRWAGRCALNVAVSDADRRVFERIAPGARFIVVPNGVDTRWFKPSGRPEGGIVFVGGYGWHPNRDALEYFCKDILPMVRRLHPSVSVDWVGRTPEEVRRQCADRYGIRLTGYVEDVRPYVDRATCYIVPIRLGGGTRLKILDAWAMGKAVVSTSQGCEGLDARNGENILIRDDPAAFADAVDRVLGDPALRRRLGESARRTVEEQYDWEVVGRPMLRAYHELIEVGKE